MLILHPSPNGTIFIVSVSDNLDTEEGESELTPIKNLFNEWYARDISKKRRISNKIKGGSGPPGYYKNTLCGTDVHKGFNNNAGAYNHIR